MKLEHVKNLVGGLLVGLHLVAIFLCFYWLKSRMSLPDFRLTILILCPITAVYALSYVREVAKFIFADTSDADDHRIVKPRFAIIASVFTVAFSAGVIYSIYDYSNLGSNMKPDDLKEQLALIETALGGFLGLIVETIFGKLPPKPGTGSG